MKTTQKAKREAMTSTPRDGSPMTPAQVEAWREWITEYGGSCGPLRELLGAYDEERKRTKESAAVVKEVREAALSFVQSLPTDYAFGAGRMEEILARAETDVLRDVREKDVRRTVEIFEVLEGTGPFRKAWVDKVVRVVVDGEEYDDDDD